MAINKKKRNRGKKRAISEFAIFSHGFMSYMRKKRYKTKEKGGLLNIVRYAWNRLGRTSAKMHLSEIDYWIDSLFLVNITIERRLVRRKGRKTYKKVSQKYISIRKADSSRGLKLYDYFRQRHSVFYWWMLQDMYLSIYGNSIYSDSTDKFVMTDEDGTSVSFSGVSSLSEFYYELKDMQSRGLFKNFSSDELPYFEFKDIVDKELSLPGYDIGFTIGNFTYGYSFLMGQKRVGDSEVDIAKKADVLKVEEPKKVEPVVKTEDVVSEVKGEDRELEIERLKTERAKYVVELVKSGFTKEEIMKLLK